MAHGAEGTGLGSIEHHWPRSVRPDLQDEYDNCFYACRFCNGARAARPNEHRGARLLNPCDTPWASHFASRRDELVARRRDRSAAYTVRAYDFNDPRRSRMRRERATQVAAAMEVLERTIIERLLAVAEGATRADRAALLEAAADERRDLMAAKRTLERYTLVPADAGSSCRCAADRVVPDYLSDQGLEIPD